MGIGWAGKRASAEAQCEGDALNTRLSILSALMVLALAACGGGAQPAGSEGAGAGSDTATSEAAMSEAGSAGATEAKAEAEAGTFPVTIKHALGETTIKEKPQRVAALGWGNDDAALALGVAPVALPVVSWGGNENKSLPWRDEALKELGAAYGTDKAPIQLDDSNGIPLEDIARAKPDVILAMTSGITADDYKKLEEIAPVVAYPEKAWATSWQDTLDMAGKALGEEAKAKAVKEETEQLIADQAEKHPELKDKTFIYGHLGSGEATTIGFYSHEDNRPRMMEAVGMKIADVAVKADEATDKTWIEWSPEKASELESDVYFTFETNEGDAEKVKADPLLQQIPAVKAGNLVIDEDKVLHQVVSGASPISLKWGLEKYLDHVVQSLNTK